MTNILITGRPGVGKTTLIRQIIGELNLAATGFFTEEIRERGRRTGFRIQALTPGLPRMDGVLAGIGLPGPYRHGAYGINLTDMEEVAARALEESLLYRDLIVIDEIGNMEIVSSRFQEAVIACLESDLPVLGVIKAGSGPFVDRIKSRPDVEIVELTRDRFAAVTSTVIEAVKLLVSRL